MTIPSQADPCGPGCAWCAGIDAARVEACGWSGHEWLEDEDSRECTSCGLYEIKDEA